MPLDHQLIAKEVEERFGTFFRERINPTAALRDQTYSTFDRATLKEMAAVGLIGFTADESIGGQGRTWEEWGHALEEIGYLADDSGLPMLLSYRETAINLLFHSAKGKPHLLDKYCRPAVRGDAFIGWLFTEEKDIFNLETKVIKKGGRYILNGHKTASTGGMSCTSWIVYARTQDMQDTLAIMVERDDPGVSVKPVPALGLRSMGLAEVTFENVELSEDRILAAEDGASHGQIFVNERRVTGAAWITGRMRSLIERVIEDTQPKIRLNRHLIDFDTFRAAIGKMYIALEAARSINYRVFARVEKKRHDHSYIHDSLLAMAKYISTESAIEVANLAQRLSGGHGYFEAYGIERCLRDFFGLVPIVGGQLAIEVEVGGRRIFQFEGKQRALRKSLAKLEIVK